MKFATKLIPQYPPHLRRVATLPWEIKNSNFWPPVNCACVPQRLFVCLLIQLIAHATATVQVNSGKLERVRKG